MLLFKKSSLWGCYKPRHVAKRDVFLFINSKFLDFEVVVSNMVPFFAPYTNRQPNWTTLSDSLIKHPYWTALLDNLIVQPYWTALNQGQASASACPCLTLFHRRDLICTYLYLGHVTNWIWIWLVTPHVTNRDMLLFRKSSLWECY